jgi:hypothetical protein
MQSISPIPGSPWPHEMVLEIEDSPEALRDLLWLREACRLQPTGVDLPPLLVHPPLRPAEAMPDAERLLTWQQAWPIVWDEVLEHAGRPRQSERLQRLLEAPSVATDRAALIREFIGPTWRDRFGDEVFDDDGYRRWMAADADRDLRHHLGYEQSPEFVALDAMIPAWRAGLVKVVTIPCAGTFTRVLGRSTLLVTDATRDDPDAYRDALARFTEDAPLS